MWYFWWALLIWFLVLFLKYWKYLEIFRESQPPLVSCLSYCLSVPAGPLLCRMWLPQSLRFSPRLSITFLLLFQTPTRAWMAPGRSHTEGLEKGSLAQISCFQSWSDPGSPSRGSSKVKTIFIIILTLFSVCVAFKTLTFSGVFQRLLMCGEGIITGIRASVFLCFMIFLSLNF